MRGRLQVGDPDDRVRIGALATAAGVSVRTLRYYEEIGLISPASWTPAGHRLYGMEELVRIQRVRSLVRLGFSLSEIREYISDPRFSVAQVLRLRLRALDEQIDQQHRMRSRLALLVERIGEDENVSDATFLGALEELDLMERYFTEGERRQLRKRSSQLGPAALREAPDSWERLIRELQHEMAAGADPLSPFVLDLARRWKELVEAFTNRDPGIEQGVRRVWQAERGRLEHEHGESVPTQELFAFIGPALAAID